MRVAEQGFAHEPVSRTRGSRGRLAWNPASAKAARRLSGAQQGDIGLALAAGNQEAAKRNALHWAKVFPGGFYIELQRAGQPGGEQYVQQAVALAASLKLPVVATHPMQFMTPDDFTAHEARVCISEGDTPRESAASEALYARAVFPHARRNDRAVRGHSVGAVTSRWRSPSAAISHSNSASRNCRSFRQPDGMSLDDYLVHLSKEGLGKASGAVVPR